MRSTMEDATDAMESYESFYPQLLDVLRRAPLFEAEVGGQSVVVEEELWRACTGRRWRNGEEHHGPVYNLGTGETYWGKRSCSCRTCQSTVSPLHRPN